MLAIFFSCVFSWSPSPRLSLFVSIFYSFSCFWCVFPTSSGLPLGLVPCFSSSVSFLRHQLHILSCISFCPILVFSPPPAFLGSSGFRFCCGVCFFLRFRLWPHLFFTLLSLLFRMLRFGLLFVVFLSIFPHAVATVDCFLSSSVLFRPTAFLAVPSCFSPPFQSVLTLPVLSGLRPGFSASCASGCSLLLARLLLSSVLQVLRWRSLGCPGAAFPVFLLVFFRKVFTACFIFLWLSLVLHSLPWCLLLLVLVVVFFALASVLPPPVLPCSVWCGFMVLCFLTRLNLRFPSRRGLPLGQVRVASASVFARAGILSIFVTSPFLCLVRIWNYHKCRVHPVGCVWFPWCSVLFGVGSFLRYFLFLLIHVAFVLLLALP